MSLTNTQIVSSVNYLKFVVQLNNIYLFIYKWFLFFFEISSWLLTIIHIRSQQLMSRLKFLFFIFWGFVFTLFCLLFAILFQVFLAMGFFFLLK